MPFHSATAVEVRDAVARADSSWDVAVADVNGDGHPDIFVANMFDQANEVLLGDGAGGFVSMTEGDAIARTDNSYGVAIVDVNGDGQLDIFVANSGQANELLYDQVCGDGHVVMANGVCTRCSAFSIGVVSGDECVFCPGGTTGPIDRRTRQSIRGWRSDHPYVCIPCDAGKVRGHTDQIEECVECPVGLYAVAGSGECSECSAGRVPNVNNVGASGCVSCSAGQGPNSNATACISCTTGRYSSFGVECQECAAPRVVQQSASQCNACPAGAGPNDNRTGCISCHGTEYSTTGECAQCAAPNIVEDNFQTCRACSAGEASNDGRTACISCIGNTFSKFGIECETCPRGTSANADRTQCNEIEQGQELTDSVVLDTILNGTDFLRPTASLKVDVSDAVLVDGSVAQNDFFQQVAADLATALAVEMTVIKIIGIQHTNRRILQSTSAAQLEFEIAPAAAASVMLALNSLMDDASSPSSVQSASTCPPGQPTESGARPASFSTQTQTRRAANPAWPSSERS